MLIFIPVFLISLAADTDKAGFYKYCDGYTFKYIDLKKDHTFLNYYRSCKGSIRTKGNWVSSGDTIFLAPDGASNDTLFIEDDRIYDHADKQVRDSEPYSRMKSKNTRDKTDCCRSCYDR